MLTFEIFNNIDECDKLETQWNALLQASNTENVFLSYSWVRNWIKHYHKNIEKLCIVTVFDNKKCIAIAPFYVSSFYSKTLSLIGTNEPEECEVNAEGMDIIYLVPYREELLDYLVAIIEKSISANIIALKNIVESSLIHSISKKLSKSKANHQFEPCYQFIFNQLDNIENSLFINKKNKRTLNKFLKDDECTFEIAHDSASKKELFNALVKLHHDRWETKGKQGVFDNKIFLSFHNTLLLDKQFTQSILLSAIKYKGEIISVNYSFFIQKKIYFYQAGINTTFKPNFSPGLLNHLLLIKKAEELGVNEYNLLLSHEQSSYKNGLSNNQTKLISIEIYKYIPKNLLKIIRLKLISKIKNICSS